MTPEDIAAIRDRLHNAYPKADDVAVLLAERDEVESALAVVDTSGLTDLLDVAHAVASLARERDAAVLTLEVMEEERDALHNFATRIAVAVASEGCEDHAAKLSPDDLPVLAEVVEGMAAQSPVSEGAEVEALREALAATRAEVERLKASFVPQPVALMMLAALDRADMGPQGSTNDLGSMVRRACEEVTRLRAEVERLTLAPETVAMLRTRAAYPRSPWVGLEAVDAHLNASRAWVEAGGPNLPTDEEETSR